MIPRQQTQTPMLAMAGPSQIECSPASMVRESVSKRLSMSSRDACSLNGQNSTEGEKTAKSVSWYGKVKARKYIHVGQYTNDEIKQCWYTNEDFRAFSQEARVTARLIETGHLKSDTVNFCKRGTERFLQATARQQQDIHDAVVGVVLGVQEMQRRTMGSCDPDVLAHVYENVSSTSRFEAREQGLDDEMDGVNIIMSN